MRSSDVVWGGREVVGGEMGKGRGNGAAREGDLHRQSWDARLVPDPLETHEWRLREARFRSGPLPERGAWKGPTMFCERANLIVLSRAVSLTKLP